MIRLFILLDECSYQLAAKLTSPDPDLQLRLVKVLHVVSNEPVEQVTDQGLEHHDFSPPAVTRWRVAFSPRRISTLAICDRVSLGSITVASCRERASIGRVKPLILPPFTFTSYIWYKARYEEINKGSLKQMLWQWNLVRISMDLSQLNYHRLHLFTSGQNQAMTKTTFWNDLLHQWPHPGGNGLKKHDRLIFCYSIYTHINTQLIQTYWRNTGR